ncbi:MAG: hypothetical protein KatS3mg102_1250 [Planctomycetota bacterium]|nr:MAG: hypothetical protein KatS3mg102_1250 [Planctomycetota bacterium]
MKASPYCLPCILRQVLNTARQVTEDAWLHRKVLSEAMLHLAKVDLDRSPAEIISEVERLACKALGNHDPFAALKKQHTTAALAVQDRVKEAIAAADDPLRVALLAAIGANVLDGAVLGPVDLAQGVELALAQGLVLDDYPELLKDLEGARRVLYVCDSAGEIVLDRLVMEQLRGRGLEVACAVRRAVVLNDAVRADAEALGLGEVASVIDTGSDDMGVPVPLTAGEFREHYQAADLVLAKGAANYETLLRDDTPAYFGIWVKCPVVARDLGVEVGERVLVRR